MINNRLVGCNLSLIMKLQPIFNPNVHSYSFLSLPFVCFRHGVHSWCLTPETAVAWATLPRDRSTRTKNTSTWSCAAARWCHMTTASSPRTRTRAWWPSSTPWFSGSSRAGRRRTASQATPKSSSNSCRSLPPRTPIPRQFLTPATREASVLSQ